MPTKLRPLSERRPVKLSAMSETTAGENGITPAARMGKAIVRGALIGLPIAFVGIALTVWLIADVSLRDAIVTAILPGVLLGVFGGGFAGMASTMEE